ncbi:MAG TPA: sigma-70 family RNA polymerase sigma factor [Syntrophobacteraceae bacterium]|nr:sigma-70 family RNA polymerase sigma factor [Syntrophobacteraceae bacterium]
MRRRKDNQDYLRKHKESLIDELMELTKDFPFKPRDELPEKSRRSRVEEIIDRVYYFASKAFYQIPLAVRRAEDKDDLIQDALVIFFTQTQEYKPEKSYYDTYIRGIVSRRLKDKQRELSRKNPVVGNTALRMFEECDQEELEAFAENNDGSADFGPAKSCLDKELMHIVMECLEKLEPYQRGIIIERCLDGDSYKEIAARRPTETLQALRGQARRGLPILKNCVEERYGVGVQAWP